MSAMSGNNLFIMKWPAVYLILRNFVAFTFMNLVKRQNSLKLYKNLKAW